MAECLKNNDLMAILTRSVFPCAERSLVCFRDFLLIKTNAYIVCLEPHLQISSPTSSSCPTGRAQGSWILEERIEADIKGALLSQRSLERRTGGPIHLVVLHWTVFKRLSSRLCWLRRVARPHLKTTSPTQPISTIPATFWPPSSGWRCR